MERILKCKDLKHFNITHKGHVGINGWIVLV
uniref:Uncharacterized protein n=1 Tax=Lotus japonicus TaxID=34305 RepID=I3TAK8_LOTJA|nr:unknown [Lotus japonicus]